MERLILKLVGAAMLAALIGCSGGDAASDMTTEQEKANAVAEQKAAENSGWTPEQVAKFEEVKRAEDGAPDKNAGSGNTFPGAPGSTGAPAASTEEAK